MCVIIYLLQDCDEMSSESISGDGEEDMETTQDEEQDEVSIKWTIWKLYFIIFYKSNFQIIYF